MKLTMDKGVYEAMLGAARKAAPLEACGLLGGKNSYATMFFELTNADASGEHYSMYAEEQFDAVKKMRANGVRMLAIWHSHPATPARMSEEDLRLAYTPEVAYIILSLATEEIPEIRGFVVEDGKPEEISVAVLTHSAAEMSDTA